MYHKAAIASLTMVLTLGALSAANGESLSAPAPLRENVLASSQDCATCHDEIYGKWKDSMHSQSVSDPIFKTAYMEAYLATKGEAKKLCMRCHAPAVYLNGDYDLEQPITAEGVTCHFCHSVVEVKPLDEKPFTLKIGKTIRGPRGTAESGYHATVKSDIHKKSEFCAGCHEYEAGGIKIMGTYSEWKNGPYAKKGIQCQDCHMPPELVKDKSGGKKRVFSHYLAGGHSIMQLRKAVTVRVAGIVRGKDRITVELELENSGSGHYVPTGIPTRRLLLSCVIKTSDKKALKKKVTYEKVIFDPDGKELTKDADIMLGLGTRIVKDNRLAPGEKRKVRLVYFTNPDVEVAVSAWVEYVYSPDLAQPTQMKVEMSRAERFFSK